MTWQRQKMIIAGVFLLSLAAFLAYYITLHIHDFRQLSLSLLGHLPLVFLAAALFVVLLAFNGYRFYCLLLAFHLKLPAQEWFGLSVITNFYNLVTPFRGGMAIRALYLKRRYGFTYTHFLTVQAAFQVLILLTAAITGLVSVLVLEEKFAAYHEPFILFFLGLATVLALILLFSPRLEVTGGKWRQRLAGISNGWHLLKKNKKRVLTVSLITLIQRFIKAVFLMLVYSSLHIQLDFFAALFISSLGMFSLVITILPGNLGIDDTVNVFAANLLGIPLEGAIAAALLARLINLAVGLLSGPPFSYLLLKKTREDRKQRTKDGINKYLYRR